MSRSSSHDDDTDPATGVLKNRLGITDEATLETTEAQFVAQRSHELVQDPILARSISPIGTPLTLRGSR